MNFGWVSLLTSEIDQIRLGKKQCRPRCRMAEAPQSGFIMGIFFVFRCANRSSFIPAILGWCKWYCSPCRSLQTLILVPRSSPPSLDDKRTNINRNNQPPGPPGHPVLSSTSSNAGSTQLLFLIDYLSKCIDDLEFSTCLFRHGSLDQFCHVLEIEKPIFTLGLVTLKILTLEFWIWNPIFDAQKIEHVVERNVLSPGYQVLVPHVKIWQTSELKKIRS